MSKLLKNVGPGVWIDDCSGSFNVELIQNDILVEGCKFQYRITK